MAAGLGVRGLPVLAGAGRLGAWVNSDPVGRFAVYLKDIGVTVICLGGLAWQLFVLRQPSIEVLVFLWAVLGGNGLTHLLRARAQSMGALPPDPVLPSPPAIAGPSGSGSPPPALPPS